MVFLLTLADFSLDFSENRSVISLDKNVLASQNFARIVMHIWSLHSYCKLNSICSAITSKRTT